VTEGHTLLPHAGSDKRTKEVFVVSLERMTTGLQRGIAHRHRHTGWGGINQEHGLRCWLLRQW